MTLNKKDMTEVHELSEQPSYYIFTYKCKVMMMYI